MQKKRVEELYLFYNSTLQNDIIPFWLKHSMDKEYGGYLTCVDRDGSLVSTDKSVWMQGRGVWVFSKMCNEFGYNEEWENAAKLGYEFLTNFCYDTDNRLFFQMARDGRPLRKRRYLFSETFAVIGCAEYSKVTGDKKVLEKALDTYKLLLDYYYHPDMLQSKFICETRRMKSLSMLMILVATTQSIREVDNSPVHSGVIASFIDEILNDFVKRDKKVLLEYVEMDGGCLDEPQGRLINPGHAIETAWFILEEGKRQNNQKFIESGLEILEWSLERGWDKEYGGIFYFLDSEGKPPDQIEWDMKLWWPHNEALYALLRAYEITRDPKYSEWYEKVHEWTFAHFPDKVYGEWFGYLHRDGSVSLPVKGSIWKGIFHVPRQFIMSTKILKEMLGQDSWLSSKENIFGHLQKDL